jgi:uncharacterized tellurite resistance protein B-like protein
MDSLLEMLNSDENNHAREIRKYQEIIKKQQALIMKYKQELCNVIEQLSPETGSDMHEKCCELYNDVLQLHSKYQGK